MDGWYGVLLLSLRNLKAWNSNGLAISVTSSRQQRALPPREFEPLRQAVRFDAELRQLEDPEEYALHILEVISKSQCSVSELSLPDPSWEVKLRHFCMFDQQRSTIIESCMSHIRVLDLTISTEWFHKYVYNGFGGIRRLLTTSPHLATLKLRTHTARALRFRRQEVLSHYEDFALAEVVSTSFMPSLQHADLKLSFRSRSEIVAFIQRHR